MNKAYKRINWENRPSTATPMNETNMNKMDYALDVVDTRVVELYNQKDAMALATANANKAADSANAAATSANTAAANANEAAQAVLDEKYILTATTEMVKSGTARPTAKGNALLEKLAGSSWQRKLTGKNLYNEKILANCYTLNGVTLTQNSDLSLVLIGTATANTNFMQKTFTLKPGTYVYSTPGRGTQAESGISVCLFDRTHETFIAYNPGIITIDEEIVMDVRIQIANGRSVNSKFHIQLELGSAATDYEPYCGNTPSPNPEFQQTIRYTGDMGWFDGEWVNKVFDEETNSWTTINNGRFSSKNGIPYKNGDIVTITTKNGFNTIGAVVLKDGNYYQEYSYTCSDNTATEYSFPAPYNGDMFFIFVYKPNMTMDEIGDVCVTINGKYAVIVDEVGKNLFDESTAKNGYIINDSGNEVSDTTSFYFTQKIKVEENEEYYISISGRQRLYLYDTNGKFKERVSFSTNGSYTIPIGVGYISVQVYTSDYVSGANYICKGNTATPYTPHQHKRTYIPISEPLRAIGDVKDELVPVDGWYKGKRRIIHAVLNANWAWNLYFSEPGYFHVALDDEYYARNNVASINIASDSYVGISRDEMRAVNVDKDSISIWNGELVVRDTRFTTVDEFKAFLEEIEVDIYYVVAEPYYEELDQTPFYNLQSFDEVTHVSIAGLHEELEPTLTMRFPRHEDGALVTTSYCNSKKEAIERKAEMEEIKAAVLALSQS